jgi:hypothetical protein
MAVFLYLFKTLIKPFSTIIVKIPSIIYNLIPNDEKNIFITNLTGP